MKSGIYLLLSLVVALGVASQSQLLAQGNNLNLPGLPHKKIPPGALPDLRVESAVFRYTSAEVVIKNTGTAPSKSTGMLLEIYATTEPGSPIKWILTQNIPSLAPGKEYKTTFGTPSSAITYNGHARRIVLDPTNSVIESNERNNQLFSNDTPQADEGAFPEGALFDLTFSKVKFISHAEVEFCVKNLGSIASGEYHVRTTIFNGPKKTSGQYKTQTVPFNSLAAGQEQCFKFQFATYSSGEEVFVGRSRLIEILSSGTEANGGNNSYFEPAAQAPWTP